MRYVVFALLVIAGLVAVLSLVAGLASAGTHGLIVIVCGLLPLLLSAVSGIAGLTFPRWAAGISFAAFLVAGMKTREAESLSNIMVVAFIGILVSIALLIKPYRPAATRVR